MSRRRNIGTSSEQLVYETFGQILSLLCFLCYAGAQAAEEVLDVLQFLGVLGRGTLLAQGVHCALAVAAVGPLTNRFSLRT
jgi:hypothetical protein